MTDTMSKINVAILAVVACALVAYGISVMSPELTSWRPDAGSADDSCNTPDTYRCSEK